MIDVVSSEESHTLWGEKLWREKLSLFVSNGMDSLTKKYPHNVDVHFAIAEAFMERAVHESQSAANFARIPNIQMPLKQLWMTAEASNFQILRQVIKTNQGFSQIYLNMVAKSVFGRIRGRRWKSTHEINEIFSESKEQWQEMLNVFMEQEIGKLVNAYGELALAHSLSGEYFSLSRELVRNAVASTFLAREAVDGKPPSIERRATDIGRISNDTHERMMKVYDDPMQQVIIDEFWRKILSPEWWKGIEAWRRGGVELRIGEQVLPPKKTR